jgi:hypothetical protein
MSGLAKADMIKETSRPKEKTGTVFFSHLLFLEKIGTIMKQEMISQHSPTLSAWNKHDAGRQTVHGYRPEIRIEHPFPI